jgi:hypothetical protein
MENGSKGARLEIMIALSQDALEAIQTESSQENNWLHVHII